MTIGATSPILSVPHQCCLLLDNSEGIIWCIPCISTRSSDHNQANNMDGVLDCEPQQFICIHGNGRDDPQFSSTFCRHNFPIMPYKYPLLLGQQPVYNWVRAQYFDTVQGTQSCQQVGCCSRMWTHDTVTCSCHWS